MRPVPNAGSSRSRLRLPALPLAAALTAGSTVATIAGAAALAADRVFRHLTAPRRAGVPLQFGFTPFETGVVWEDVTVLAGPAGSATSGPGVHQDGAPQGDALGGWLLPRDDDAPAILACGGYRGRRSDLLGIGSSLWRAGCTVLLFDYHGYGDTPGPATLGYRELADARAALRYLRQRFPRAPLGIIGFSMGASVAIMLAAREPDLRAVIADSPFTSQRDVVRYGLARSAGLRRPLRHDPLATLILALVDRRLARRYGFRFDDVAPLDDVPRLATPATSAGNAGNAVEGMPRPLLLIHGEADRTIPVEHSRQIAAAAAAAGVPVETWLVPGAGHCDAYFLHRQTYCDRTAAFFTTHLRTTNAAAGADTGRIH